MLKLTKTGIGLLTRQYRSVLKKCWAINVGLFALTSTLIGVFPGKGIAGIEVGDGASAPHTVAIAIGQNVYATGSYAIAIGNPGTVADSRDAIAIGGSSRALDEFAISIGAHSIAHGEFSIALGGASIADKDNVISVGHLSTDLDYNGNAYGSDLFRKIINVAEGSDANDVVIVSQLNSALANKQDALSTAQLAAANSGITATKVRTYDGYATTIAGKADKATTLSGYGITDAYTKGEVDDLISGSGSSYTAGTGISLANKVISLDSDYLDNNYYRKNKKSGILNGFEAGKIGNENDDNFSKLAANDNFATTTFLRAI